MRRSILAGARALGRDEGGLALIEFAFTLPVLITLVMCGLETANLALANLKVNQMAMLVADNAARVRDTIDEQEVNSLLYGAKKTGEGLKFGANGRIILSDVVLNTAKTGQWIRWQRCSGAKQVSSPYTAGQGQNNNSLQSVGVGSNTIAATENNAIMYAEVYYTYQPLVSNLLFGERTIVWRAAFNVRQRSDETLYAVTGVTASSCSTYSATTGDPS